MVREPAANTPTMVAHRTIVMKSFMFDVDIPIGDFLRLIRDVIENVCLIPFTTPSCGGAAISVGELCRA